MSRFGVFIKKHREKVGISIRAFCKKINYDASNWSKVEKGIKNPPQNQEKLSKIAQVLDIKKDSEEWQELFDAALIKAGVIPPDLHSQEELLDNFPSMCSHWRKGGKSMSVIKTKKYELHTKKGKFPLYVSLHTTNQWYAGVLWYKKEGSWAANEDVLLKFDLKSFLDNSEESAFNKAVNWAKETLDSELKISFIEEENF